VSDQRLHELLRAAQASDTGEAWLAHARALVQVGRHDAAGASLRRAVARGADASLLAAQLDPRAEAFQLRVLREDGNAGPLGSIAWSPCGERVLAVELEHTVLEFTLDGAAPRRVGSVLPLSVQALAPSPAGTQLALALRHHGGISDLGGLAVLDLASGELRGWVDRGERCWPTAIAWPFDRPEVVIDAGEQVLEGWRLDQDAPAPLGNMRDQVAGELLWTADARGPQRSLDPAGRHVALDGERVVFHDAAGEPLREVTCPWLSRVEAGELRLFGAGDRALILSEPVASLGITLAVVSAPQGELARVDLAGEILDLELAPSGRRVAVTHWDQDRSGMPAPEVTLLELSSGASRRFELPQDPWRLAWSPSGRRLAIGGVSGMLAVLEPAS
jgi:hypothetical protein